MPRGFGDFRHETARIGLGDRPNLDFHSQVPGIGRRVQAGFGFVWCPRACVEAGSLVPCGQVFFSGRRPWSLRVQGLPFEIERPAASSTQAGRLSTASLRAEVRCSRYQHSLPSEKAVL